MDGSWNMQRRWLRLALLGAATLVPVAGLQAETLTSDGKPQDAAAVSARARIVTAAQVKALAQSVVRGLAELREEVARAVLADQLTLIAGHVPTPTPPSSASQPPPPPTPPGGGVTVPPAPPGNGPPPPPPPPPPGNTPPPPTNTPPPSNTPPPPVNSGGPGPVHQAPEPGTMVTALIGAGLASLAAWRSAAGARSGSGQ